MARKQEDLEHLTFLIEGEHILVFTGDVVMDRSSADQYFEFRVQELLAEVRASLSAGDDVEGARDQAV